MAVQTAGSTRKPVELGRWLVKWGKGYDQEGIASETPVIYDGTTVFVVEIPDKNVIKRVTTTKPVLAIKQEPAGEGDLDTVGEMVYEGPDGFETNVDIIEEPSILDGRVFFKSKSRLDEFTKVHCLFRGTFTYATTPPQI